MKDIDKILTKAGIGLLGETGTKVVFRSNITPEMTVDIANLMKGELQELLNKPNSSSSTKELTKDPTIEATNQKLLKFVQPEVRLNVLGNHITYAPYGRPQRVVAIIIFFALVISALLGAKIMWSFCKKV